MMMGPMKKLLQYSKILILSLVTISFVSIFTFKSVKMDLETKIQHANAVFITLQTYTDSGVKFPALVVDESDEINAYTDGKTVTITTAMLEFLQTDDEMAIILGHEIGHVMLGHLLNWDIPVISPTINESNADRYGVYLALRAGYDPCAGEALWQRMIDKYGHETVSLDNIHPPLDTREASMDFPMCHLIYKF